MCFCLKHFRLTPRNLANVTRAAYVRLRPAERSDLTHCHLMLSVWDHDTSNADDLIGTCVFSFRDLIAQVRAKFLSLWNRWKSCSTLYSVAFVNGLVINCWNIYVFVCSSMYITSMIMSTISL